MYKYRNKYPEKNSRDTHTIRLILERGFSLSICLGIEGPTTQITNANDKGRVRND